jgi:hypothetical protein
MKDPYPIMMIMVVIMMIRVYLPEREGKGYTPPSPSSAY